MGSTIRPGPRVIRHVAMTAHSAGSVKRAQPGTARDPRQTALHRLLQNCQKPYSSLYCKNTKTVFPLFLAAVVCAMGAESARVRHGSRISHFRHCVPCSNGAACTICHHDILEEGKLELRGPQHYLPTDSKLPTVYYYGPVWDTLTSGSDY